MKRFHVNLAVSDLGRSRQFYSSLFGAEPSVLKEDYAKWMLDDPALNFSITASASKKGVQHLGLQLDHVGDLDSIRERLQHSGEATSEQPETECCYARSSKSWAKDPDNLSWESFVTHEQISRFGSGGVAAEAEAVPARRCCA